MKYTLFTIILIGFLSCKCSKKATSEVKDTESAPPEMVSIAPAETNTAGNPSDQATPPQNINDLKKQLPDTIRLLISFISIGEGTDQMGMEILSNNIESFFAKYGKRPAYISIPWGREGEVDLFFNLKELNSSEQLVFISNLQSSYKDHKLVQITENTKNRFKR